MHFRGRYVWMNGDVYEGEWYDGLRSRFGTQTYSDGRRYKGFWEHDMWNGYGELDYSDGNPLKGRFLDMEFIG